MPSRYGLTATDIADAVETAKLGKLSSDILKDDRLVNIRVLMDPKTINRVDTLRNLPLRTAAGDVVRLEQVADVIETPGDVELNRENLRQFVAVTGRPEGLDLGSVMKMIQAQLAGRYPPGVIEFGGTFQQQQEAFHNLMLVMIMAVLLIFTVLLLEFRSFLEPLAIVIGALLALIGAVAGLYMMGISENIISRLGAIIGVGIVAKNGILMLDYVDHLRRRGLSMEEALVQSGRRRLRPVLMTSMAAALGMLPLAYGVGSGADMLRPLAVAVIGALCISVLLSLVATPTVFYLMWRLSPRHLFRSLEHDPIQPPRHSRQLWCGLPACSLLFATFQPPGTLEAPTTICQKVWPHTFQGKTHHPSPAAFVVAGPLAGAAIISNACFASARAVFQASPATYTLRPPYVPSASIAVPSSIFSGTYTFAGMIQIYIPFGRAASVEFVSHNKSPSVLLRAVKDCIASGTSIHCIPPIATIRYRLTNACKLPAFIFSANSVPSNAGATTFCTGPTIDSHNTNPPRHVPHCIAGAPNARPPSIPNPPPAVPSYPGDIIQ